jgi:carbonic anhydrase
MRKWLRTALGLRFVLVTALAFLLPSLTAGEPASTASLLERLKAGNARFIHGALQPSDLVAARKASAAKQRPYAIILACSDSRLGPELIFDEELGQLFVVRVAGNVVDPVVLGSIEYAAEHLHSTLVVVMGHESCGAVQAALAGGHAPVHIDSLVGRIEPAVRKVNSEHLAPSSTLDAAIEENVRLQMRELQRESPVLRGLVRKHQLTIVGGEYHLRSGTVTFLPASGAAP